MRVDKNNVNIDNEQLILAYLMRNQDKIVDYDKKFFINPICSAIFVGLKKLEDNGDTFNLDTLHQHVNADYNCNFSVIKDIHECYTEFPNIETHSKMLENDYLKNVVAKNYVNEIITRVTQKDFVSVSELKDLTQDLLYNLSSVNSEHQLLSMPELSARHLVRIDEREKTEFRKSIGFKELDERLTRPAAPGQITMAYALSGSGKSISLKNMESNLIDKGVCVLSISTEMLEENDMDRLVCIREEGIHIEDMISPKNPRIKQQIKFGIEKLAEIKNYMYFNESESSLNLDIIDELIIKAKKKFKEAGVLPEDEYMVVAIDLVSDLDDFGKQTKEDIIYGMKKLHRMTKKHKIHTIIIVQANENKLRNGKIFKDPEALDNFRLTLEDVYGGTEYRKKCKVAFSIMRPLEMKKMYFPDQHELWDTMEDYCYFHIIKQNEGGLAYVRMLFTDTMRIVSPVDSDI